MKSKITQNIKAIILGLVLTLGLSYVLADFTPPPSSPPTCDPATTPACNAPINVGSLAQIKAGSLTLGGLGIVGDFKFLPNATAQATPGQVLTATDNTGKVEWKDAPGINVISFPSGGSGGSTSGIWVKPDGVTSFRVQVWGGGGAGNTGRNDGSNSKGGGGGGAGGYIEAIFTTTAAEQKFGYTIGIGGQPASSVCNNGGGTVGGGGGISDFKQLSTGNVLTAYGGTPSSSYPTGGTGGGYGSLPNDSDSAVTFLQRVNGKLGDSNPTGTSYGKHGGSILFSSGGQGVSNADINGNRYKDGSYPGGGGGGGSGQDITCPLGAGRGGDGRVVVSW